LAGISAASLSSLEDLQGLPLTSKDELRQHNADFFAADRSELVDFVSTSGSTGQAVSVALTEKDLQRLARNEAQSFQVAGLQKNDVIQLMTTMDKQFMAGMAYFLGARQLGAGIIRAGSGSPSLQWQTILKLKPSVAIAVPSFFSLLIDYAEAEHIDFLSSSLKKVICIGEPIRLANFELNALGRRISERWPIELHSTYASTEGATAFTDCVFGNGGHEQDDLIITEVIREDGTLAQDGEIGEVVVTPLGLEGLPLLRFKTGDICTVHYSKCQCGREGLRLGAILGRTDHMIKLKGTSIYPSAIIEIIRQEQNSFQFQIEISSTNLGTDHVHIYLSGSAKESSIASLRERLRAGLRVLPDITIISSTEMDHRLYAGASRKALTLIDNRAKRF
jgi:phenylacetate-CoA ligase